MKGRVIEAAEIVIPMVLFDNAGRPAEIDSILDTGATCALTLPPEALEELGSAFLRDDMAQVAGDEIIPCRVFEIDVLWTAGRRTIEVFELESVPLLGLQLLADHRLIAEIRDDGEVDISPISTDYGPLTTDTHHA